MQNTGKIKPSFGRYRKLHENMADFGNHDVVTTLIYSRATGFKIDIFGWTLHVFEKFPATSQKY